MSNGENPNKHLSGGKVAVPLRISRDRVRLYGGTLICLGLLPLLLFPNADGNRWRWSLLWGGNWAYFVGGGATVGTRDLLGSRHIAWEAAHGFIISLPWAYPPAVAWLFAPFAHMPLSVGFWTNAIAMLAACVAAGIIAARIYGLTPAFSVLAVLAWEPATASIYEGQNASFALFLCVLCIFGLSRGKWVVTGVAVGLLLFKPTDALAFVLLLLLRREWRALAVVGAVSVGWYFASVSASAGDWLWPYHYAFSMYAYYPHPDFSSEVIGASSLAIRLGAPALVGNGISTLLLLWWCAIVPRVSTLEAASFAGLVAVATSPHANSYEAALLASAVFWVMTNVREPWRTWIVAVAYALGALSALRWFVSFDVSMVLVNLGAVSYIAIRLAYWDRANRTPTKERAHAP